MVTTQRLQVCGQCPSAAMCPADVSLSKDIYLRERDRCGEGYGQTYNKMKRITLLLTSKELLPNQPFYGHYQSDL